MLAWDVKDRRECRKRAGYVTSNKTTVRSSKAKAPKTSGSGLMSTERPSALLCFFYNNHTHNRNHHHDHHTDNTFCPSK